MLSFEKIKMVDFGPYRNEKVIDFTCKDGVTIIWGNNGYGKTSLLNAFRYALFGKIYGRVEKEKDNEKTQKILKNKTINSGSFKEGIYSFSVTLYFSEQSNKYELIRSYMLSENGLDPTNINNYKEEMQLKMNQSILSTSDRKHILNSIMPEQISRFFLFDGELLKEYEELLKDEAGIGRKIKEEIEKILGVPVLTNALADLKDITTQLEGKLSVIAQKDSATKAQGDALQRAIAELSTLNSDLSELRDQDAEETTTVEELERARKEDSRVKDLIDEIESQNAVIIESDAKISEKKLKIAEITLTAWKGMLGKPIADALSIIDQELSVLQDKKLKGDAAKQLLGIMTKAKIEGHCVVCDNKLDAKMLERLEENISKISTEFAALTSTEVARIEHLQSEKKQISKLFDSDKKETITFLEDDIMDLIVDIADARQKISEKQKDIDDYSKQKQEIEEIETNLKKALDLSASTKEGIKRLEQQIAEKEELIKKAKERLAQSSSVNAEFVLVKNRCEACNSLCKLFDGGLDSYRKYLTQQVEEDATKIFLQLSNEPLYVGLKINENYGLNIIHDSGDIVDIRSAGFEHIVALSLIGALHNNAPMQGPVVMDSPFGRLDSDHERNIITYLPKLANQVMLFVFDKEIDEQAARGILGSALLQEYQLYRKRAYDTDIKNK